MIFQEKRDLITGLKTRTNAGRPNWDKVFKQLQDKKKGKVTVFYCGPPQLAKILRYKCDRSVWFQFQKGIFLNSLKTYNAIVLVILCNIRTFK